MMFEEITPLVLTYNEAPNIARTLKKLDWAREVVLVDSYSTDETLSIARQFPNVRVIQRAFDSFAEQCNFGLEQVRTEWVLSLDADYVLSEQFITELKHIVASDDVAGFSAPFEFWVTGKALRATLYPPRTVLYRRISARYHNDGHGHRVEIDGIVRELKAVIFHDDRKPLSRWLMSQQKYAALEADKLLNTPVSQLQFPDRLRKRIVLAPVVVFFYTLFAKGMLLDGWRGWYYTLQRTYAELLLSLYLLDRRLTRSDQ